MRSYVRLISDDTELFSYEDTSLPQYRGFERKVGDVLIDLLELDVGQVKCKYESLMDSLVPPCINSDLAALEDIRLRFNKLDEEYPALWFHTHLLYSCFGEAFYSESFAVNSGLLNLKDADLLYCKSSLGDEISKTTENIKTYFKFAIEAAADDINYWKNVVSCEADNILKYSASEEYLSLSPAQRLYFFDRIEGSVANPSPIRYTEFTFKTKMILDDLSCSTAAIGPVERAEKILESGIGLHENYVLDSLRDYLQFELVKFIMADLPLLKCQNCGRIFIPRGRRDVKYCNKIAAGETLPCDAIGALRVYQHKVSEDPIFKAYNKAYKRMNSRVKYKTLTQQEFYEWSKQARETREKCVEGEISLEEFNGWLGNKCDC